MYNYNYVQSKLSIHPSIHPSFYLLSVYPYVRPYPSFQKKKKNTIHISKQNKTSRLVFQRRFIFNFTSASFKLLDLICNNFNFSNSTVSFVAILVGWSLIQFVHSAFIGLRSHILWQSSPSRTEIKWKHHQIYIYRRPRVFADCSLYCQARICLPWLRLLWQEQDCLPHTHRSRGFVETLQ